MMWNFLRDEQGQDLIEYTLLLAFVALASAALFIGAGNAVSGIWGRANTQLGEPVQQRPRMSPVWSGAWPVACPLRTSSEGERSFGRAAAAIHVRRCGVGVGRPMGQAGKPETDRCGKEFNSHGQFCSR